MVDMCGMGNFWYIRKVCSAVGGIVDAVVSKVDILK